MSPWGPYKSDATERLHFHFSLSWIGEGNGNPLQCSCLENPRDREAWWAAVYGVAQSRTQLKWLSSSSSYNANISRNVGILLIESLLNVTHTASRVRGWPHLTFTAILKGRTPLHRWRTQRLRLKAGLLLLFSHSVMSDALRPHGLQHARLPCPSPSPGACSNSCPLSW